ncbi:MAG: glycosyltransferase family 2 protein [Anaerotruncus sp.]|nr:MAG: glycosyltransferase family 2 protein [Anaerotruncus sp.]
MQSAPAGNAEIIFGERRLCGFKRKKICQRLSEENDCVKFINKSHGGAASARNAGLEPACGEFILFLRCGRLCCPRLFQ